MLPLCNHKNIPSILLSEPWSFVPTGSLTPAASITVAAAAAAAVVATKTTACGRDTVAISQSESSSCEHMGGLRGGGGSELTAVGRGRGKERDSGRGG